MKSSAGASVLGGKPEKAPLLGRREHSQRDQMPLVVLANGPAMDLIHWRPIFSRERPD